MDKYKKCINYLEASFYNEEGECSKGYSKKMCKDVSNCYYKQLLAEQAKNKLEAERNKSFENVRQLLYSEIKKLSNPNRNFDGIDEMVQQNIELKAKNKKLIKDFGIKYIEWEKTFLDNKKLVEIINSIIKYCAKTDTVEWFDYDNIKGMVEDAK